MISEFQELKTEVELLSHMYDEVVQENSNIKEEIKTFKIINELKSKKIEKLELESEQLLRKINDLENLLFLQNLQKHCVTMYQNKNIDTVVMSLLKIADPNIPSQVLKESSRNYLLLLFHCGIYIYS